MENKGKKKMTIRFGQEKVKRILDPAVRVMSI